jgi:hypothetical protein
MWIGSGDGQFSPFNLVAFLYAIRHLVLPPRVLDILTRVSMIRRPGSRRHDSPTVTMDMKEGTEGGIYYLRPSLHPLQLLNPYCTAPLLLSAPNDHHLSWHLSSLHYCLLDLGLPKLRTYWSVRVSTSGTCEFALRSE